MSMSARGWKSRTTTRLPKSVLDDLRRSGLTSVHAKAMGIEFVPAGSVLGVKVDAYQIPYPELDGSPSDFHRYRLLEKYTTTGTNKFMRYTQAKGTLNRIYLPPLLSQRWSVIAGDTSKPLLLTEGEKKAACGCVYGFASAGFGGVWSWKANQKPIPDLDLIQWLDRTVWLVFDSDTQTKLQVKAARDALAAELKSRGADVRIVELPCVASDEKIGLDDFLVVHGATGLQKLLDAAPAWIDTVARLNRDIALVQVGGKVLVLSEAIDALGQPTIALSAPADMRTKYSNDLVTVGNKKATAFDIWLRSPDRREFESIVFDPSGVPLSKSYNLWRGYAVEPRKGDCSLYLDHLRLIVCGGDEALFEYIQAWMANAVQSPSCLPGTAIVLRGKQGTGKGVAVAWFGKLFGRHYVQLFNSRHLTGNFNGHLLNALVVFADEAFWAGDKSAEGALKAMVTEPTRMLELKGKDPLVVGNYTRLLMASNHDWVVPAGMEERRFLVVDVSDKRMQDHVYFARIEKQMQNGGLEALLHHLQQLDISGVKLRVLPRTQALMETKVLSLTRAQRFWYDCLAQGANTRGGSWATEVNCNELHEMYQESSRERYRAGQTELGILLKKLVPGLQRGRRQQHGGNLAYFWTFPPLDRCRAAMAEAMQYDIRWDEETTKHPLRLRSISGK